MQRALSKTRPVRRVDAPNSGDGRVARLPSPRELRERLPLSSPGRARIEGARRAIHDVLHGRDRDRLVVVVGPCSIHDPDSVVEYAERLAVVAERHADTLVVVMRSYLEKPRSSLGWKGYLNDPDLDGSCDLAKGLERSRALLLEISERGVACASELLDPIAARYLEDLLSWTAIGARTALSQTHRELASGLPLPVGVKNGVDGDVEAAIQGALVARSPHTALSVDEAGCAGTIRSDGNPDAHVVLRGGRGGPNHDPESVRNATARARALDLARPVFVDCSHGNSQKDPRRQAAVLRAVLAQIRAGGTSIGGVLVESHLESGRQARIPGRKPDPQRSITDACIGWKETEGLLDEAADALR